jgi:hypothetical protein
MRDSEVNEFGSLSAVEKRKSNSSIVAHAPDGVRPDGPGPVLRKNNSPIVAHAPDGVRPDGPGHLKLVVLNSKIFSKQPLARRGNKQTKGTTRLG